ncbi:MAG: aspartate/glutamate racemase [Paraglaciecola sp.]|jgi:aspartate racemase
MKRGVQKNILGCKEVRILVHKNDTKSKIYDTTRIHALAAVT